MTIANSDGGQDLLSSKESIDLAIIGAGPGGYVAAIRAGQLGLRTVIIEKDKNLGGTCLLRGCIPTKALLHTADLLDEFKHAREHGIVADSVSLDFGQAQKRKSKVVTKLSRGVEFLMKKNGVRVMTGAAHIEKPGSIKITSGGGSTEVLQSRNTIIATGSVVRSLPNLDIDGKQIIGSDEVLELSEIPKSMIVLGAGAVGVEFASMYSRFGSDVTLIELLPRILPIEDEEISAELAKSFKRQRIKVFTNASFQSAVKEDSQVRVTSRIGDEDR